MENIANHLIHAQEFIQKRAVYNFGQVNSEFGHTLQAKLDSLKSSKDVSETEKQLFLFPKSNTCK